MATFFSATDVNTLFEEGKDRNHFVSLIVNNIGEYSAAITRKVSINKQIQSKCSYKTFNDIEVNENRNYNEKEEVIEYFPLTVKFENGVSYTNFINETINRIQTNTQPKLVPQPLHFKEGTLFSDSNYNNDCVKNSNKEEEKFNIEELLEIDKNLIKSLTLQLLTCSILIPNESKIDINKWIQNMVPLFERRFGKGKEGLKLFKAFAQNQVEFVCWFTQIPEYEDEDNYSTSMSIAYHIIEYLRSLKQNNVYIEEYINILENYLI